ncbi:MAG: hypothetical protein AB7O65_12025, partial [Candidatus Korobacteraceae bacterium]
LFGGLIGREPLSAEILAHEVNPARGRNARTRREKWTKSVKLAGAAKPKKILNQNTAAHESQLLSWRLQAAVFAIIPLQSAKSETAARR